MCRKFQTFFLVGTGGLILTNDLERHKPSNQLDRSRWSPVFDYQQSVVVDGWFGRETFNAIKIKFMYQITIKHGRLSAWMPSWTKTTTKVLLNVTKQDNKSWASPCVCAPCGFPDEVAHFGTGSESRRSKWDQILVCFWREARRPVVISAMTALVVVSC